MRCRETLLLVAALLCFGMGRAPAAPLSLPSGSLTVSSDTTYEGGIIGTSGAPTLTINSGITATFAAGHSLLYGTGGRWNLRGSGTLLNLGTLVYTNILNVGLSWQGSSATFVNEGLVDFVGQSVNGGLYWYDAHPGQGEFINTNGGVIQVSQPYSYEFGNGGFFGCYDSTIRVTNNGTLKLKQNEYYITNTTFETYGTGWIRIERSPSFVHGTASGKALLLVSESFQADSGGTVMDVEGEGVRFGAGNWVSSSGTFENRGLFTVTGSGGDQSQIPRGGLFKNTGTVRHFNTSSVGFRPYVAGSRFENYGTWICSNSLFYMDQVAGLTFSNMVGSTFRVIGSGTSKFFQPNYSFHNAGSVEVTDGTMSFDTSSTGLDAATMSGGVLKLGTWKAIGGNINFGFTTTDITTIDTNACVIIGGSSTFDELDVNGGSLAAVYGKFGLWNGKTYTNTSVLACGPTTQLEFGLDNTGNDAKLTLGDDTTLQATIDVADAGSLGKGTFTVVEMAGGKALTDGGIEAGTVTSEQELLVDVLVTAGVDGKVVVRVREPPGGSVLIFQ